jgi:putative ABC transport system substrate-binding protein
MAYPVPVAVAAKEATTGTKIPVVFDVVSREGNNLVASVREPGANLTGVQFIAAENEVKRFEMLLQIAPKVKRVFIAYDPKYPTIPPSLERLRSRAKELGVALVELPVQKPAEIIAELARRTKAADPGIDAIHVINEANNNEPEVLKAMLDFGKAHKIPVDGSNIATMMNGAIFSFMGDLKASGGLAAVTADKILKGTPAGTIPVMTTEEQLRINYKVIKELGLTVPDELMTIAVEVIR